MYNNNNMNTALCSSIFTVVIGFSIVSISGIAADITSTTTIPTKSPLRGQRNYQEQQQQQQTHHSRHRQRHLLEDDTECTLYLKVVEFDDGDELQEWSCEFERDYAKQYFRGVDIMDIEGMKKEDIDDSGAISGESILRTRNAYVDQSMVSGIGIGTNGETSFKLVITDPSNSVIEKIDDDDRRHLLEKNTGTFITLVVRVTSPNGSVGDASTAQLRNDVFEGENCLKSQMEACSHNQLQIQPASFGNGGVVDVAVNVNPLKDGTERSNRDEVSASARTITDELYGGQDGLGAEYDLVIFCLPTVGTWTAYAYQGRYDSYYNNNSCSSVGVLMHEVGHNIKLSHSGKGGDDVYGDVSGYMGASSSAQLCYNAVKNYRIGWYDLQIDSIDPIDYVGNPKSFVLNGISDYKKDGSSNGELISLRLEQFGYRDGVDYYLGYNRKAGPNVDCFQGCDQVILYSKDKSEEQYPSIRVAMLEVGQSYPIENYKGIGSTVTIQFDSITNNMKDAKIEISATAPPPTPPPTLACGGNGGFRVEIKIDDFAGENYWKLFKQNKLLPVEKSMSKNEYKRLQQYYDPLGSEFDGAAYCLDVGSCYEWIIYDTHGDGLNADQGGYFRGFLDDEQIFEGAAFQKKHVETFCVDENSLSSRIDPPVVSPTELPTKHPTFNPSTASPMEPPATKGPSPIPTPLPLTTKAPSVITSTPEVCHGDGFKCGFDGTVTDNIWECLNCCSSDDNEGTTLSDNLVIHSGLFRDDYYCRCYANSSEKDVKCGSTLITNTFDECEEKCCSGTKRIDGGVIYDDYYCE